MSQSPGITWPGGIHWKSMPVSNLSGSASSKFTMRESIGAHIFSASTLRGALRSSPTASSAGGGIVGHVLRLKRRNAQAAPQCDPA